MNQGNPEYAALWKDFLFHLAIGASNIRMALDCTVVLGGFMSQYLDPYLPMLREYAAANDPFERRHTPGGAFCVRSACGIKSE